MSSGLQLCIAAIYAFSIMEYGSTPYVGMAWGKNNRRIKYVQNDMLKSLLAIPSVKFFCNVNS